MHVAYGARLETDTDRFLSPVLIFPHHPKPQRIVIIKGLLAKTTSRPAARGPLEVTSAAPDVIPPQGEQGTPEIGAPRIDLRSSLAGKFPAIVAPLPDIAVHIV
jgi:hypothetical protein